jgi:hypothetical protein
MSDEVPNAAAREILRDAFTRVREQVQLICSTVGPDQVRYRPDADANSISWLIWHLTRIQDDHICGLTGEEQVWTRDGWYDRFGLPFDPAAHGYGHSGEDVAKVRVMPELLDGYHAAVHEMTLRYVGAVTVEELARVVDTRWDPPVTASVRLVSVLGDCLAHLGQADYVRGLAERAGPPVNDVD